MWLFIRYITAVDGYEWPLIDCFVWYAQIIKHLQWFMLRSRCGGRVSTCISTYILRLYVYNTRTALRLAN